MRGGGDRFRSTAGSQWGGVDPRLQDILKNAAGSLPDGYSLAGFFGRKGRSSGTPNHPGGFAGDVRIIGPDGKALPNFRSGAQIRQYEQLAQAARAYQMKNYPELANRFRWGGYFGGRWGNDEMHFDVTPGANGAMGAGSWEGGLHPAFRGTYDRGGEASRGMAASMREAEKLREQRSRDGASLTQRALRGGHLGGGTQKIEGDASLRIDFQNMPRGARVSHEASMFKSVAINRGRAMRLASEEG
jgi:hypothetical protein